MNNIYSILAVVALSGVTAANANAQRITSTLNEGWEFSKGDLNSAKQWQKVRVPHDWAIYGPFDRANDLQTVAVEQNGEKEETVKTGRTGGLPFIGKGSYRTTFEIPDTTGRNITLIFDGAMSNAHVRVNGKEVAYWPYGYNSFYTDLSDAVVPGDNTLTVELENYERASRWYPGAGLYRNVHIVNTDRVHIPVWGTYVTTPEVSEAKASVRLEMEIAGAGKGEKIDVITEIISPDGKIVATNNAPYISHGQIFFQNFLVTEPELWSPASPRLYTARTRISVNGKETDAYDTRFGIRKLEYLPETGFYLNGKPMKFKGVCNHHDLGPLGAAINRSALLHQVELLKDMGANAIRTSHNMPSPEMVEICDELGMM
ncbi:MAG: beta-galactosidase, partial [Muribaculaceae bacterium]|nr:beta-galactosidase [Muribaculaceae bacterium]